MKNFNSVGASGIVCDKGLFSSAKQKRERENEKFINVCIHISISMTTMVASSVIHIIQMLYK